MRTAKNILKTWRTGLALILWAVMFLAVNPAPTYADDDITTKINNTLNELSKKVDSGDYTLNTSNRTLEDDIKASFPSADDKVVEYIRQYLHEDIYLNSISLFAFNSALSYNGEGYRVGTDAHVTDCVDHLNDGLKELYENGILSKKQRDIETKRIKDLVNKYAEKAREIVRNSDDSDEDKREKITIINNATIEATSRADELSGCPTVSNLRQRYQSGCWSCLVVNKLITAFLTAAEAAYEVGQRAGLVLLGLGAVLGILLWGLRNVSSMAQVDPWNILNDLMKFCFKILLAYLFISSGVKMVGRYIVNPIMGTGAEIAQQFWDDTSVNGGKSIRQEVEDFIWDDEVVTAEQEKEITQQIAKNNQKIIEEAKKEGEVKEDTPEDEVSVEPTEVAYNSTEEIVQDIQKSFIEILKKQLTEIRNSCNPGKNSLCNHSTCRFSSCSDTGHRSYVRSIWSWANGGKGKTKGQVAAYCQASITSAMNKLTELIGGDVTTVLKGASGGCALGLELGTKIKNGFSAASAKGGNIQLCINGRATAAVNKINVGDTVYYHKTLQRGAKKATILGATSGYHAVTYIGNGKIISFNGDSTSSAGDSMCNSYYYNTVGRVLCVSCLMRDKLQKNPKLADKINKQQLKSLAQGYGNMTLINYNGGGIYSSAGSDGSGASGGIDYSQFVFNIPEIKYTGPTTIMSKSVMNSIMGATRVITNTTAENLVLGHAITCYSTLDKGGAWHWHIKFAGTFVITNIFMWIQGALIWCAGFLLTLAVAYYLLDVCYKVAFAVIALPIVVGLWPFNLTKDKFAVCVSIIAKAAATFAFLAMTSSYGMRMVSTVLDGGESGNGLQKLLDAMDVAFNEGGEVGDENVEYVSNRLDLFSINFVLLMFAFIYFFRLVSATASELVNKFFPDNMFGNQNPMHQWSTAATKYATDIAKKPFSFARDVALHQTGRAVKHVVRHPVRTARGIANVAVGAVKLPSKAVKFAKKILGKKSVGGGTGGNTGGGSGGGTTPKKTPIIAQNNGNGTTPKKKAPIIAENTGSNGGGKGKKKHSSGGSDTARKIRLKNKRRARKKAHRK